MARRRPSQNKSVPFTSPHAPEILSVVAWARLATSAQIHALTTMGRRGQALATLERLLPRMVSCGLLRAVRVPSDDRRGRPLRAYHLGAAGCRAVDVDPGTAGHLGDGFRVASKIDMALRLTEVLVRRLTEGWVRVPDATRFRAVRAWVLADASRRIVDCDGVTKLRGLKGMPDDSTFSRAGIVLRRGGSAEKPHEIELVYAATSAEQIRNELRALPEFFGAQGTWQIGVVGSSNTLKQAGRTAKKVFGRRRQSVRVAEIDGDYRMRSALLGAARTVESRKGLAVRDYSVAGLMGPARRAVVAEFGFSDLSLIPEPVQTPAPVTAAPTPIQAPPPAPPAPAPLITRVPPPPPEPELPLRGAAYMRGILLRPDPGAKPKKARH